MYGSEASSVNLHVIVVVDKYTELHLEYGSDAP
jgi:hypothetical protein